MQADLELALRRLSREHRDQVRVLGVCCGGVNYRVLQDLLGGNQNEALALFSALIEAELAEDLGHGCLRLKPGLARELRAQLTTAELARATARWFEGMCRLTGVLCEQRSRHPEPVAELTRWELPNLLALLEASKEQVTAETLAVLAECLMSLVADLGEPEALARISCVRREAAGVGSNAAVSELGRKLECALEQGRMQARAMLPRGS
jgi:hypothetical protein